MMIKSLAIALLAALPAAASAQEARPEVRVAYSDLNLRTAEGVEVLDRRLAQAIESVCPSADGTNEVARKADAWRCHAKQRAIVAASRDQVLAKAAARQALVYSDPR